MSWGPALFPCLQYRQYDTEHELSENWSQLFEWRVYLAIYTGAEKVGASVSQLRQLSGAVELQYAVHVVLWLTNSPFRLVKTVRTLLFPEKGRRTEGHSIHVESSRICRLAPVWSTFCSPRGAELPDMLMIENILLFIYTCKIYHELSERRNMGKWISMVISQHKHFGAFQSLSQWCCICSSSTTSYPKNQPWWEHKASWSPRVKWRTAALGSSFAWSRIPRSNDQTWRFHPGGATAPALHCRYMGRSSHKSDKVLSLPCQHGPHSPKCRTKKRWKIFLLL